MPPTKKPNRPTAPSPVPALNLLAAPLDVAGAVGDAVEAAELALAWVALTLELALALALALVALAVALALVADAESARATTPPTTGSFASLSPSFLALWAAFLYAARVLSLGLPRGQWLMRRKIRASWSRAGDACGPLQTRERGRGLAYSFRTRTWPRWQCSGWLQNSQIGSVLLMATVKVAPYGVMTT